MRKNRTELVFILDRSGSMSGLEKDTIGGYNAMLKKQKQQEGKANVTTVLFDDHYELLHDRIDIQGVSPISEEEYYVRGSTALLDAIGKTIGKIKAVQHNTRRAYRASKVVFVITTDGMENASHEYTVGDIKKLITQQKKEHDWEFIFLGANIDALATAESFGIDKSRAANYHADSKGTDLNYRVVSDAISKIRADEELDAGWKEEIVADYESRKQD